MGDLRGERERSARSNETYDRSQLQVRRCAGHDRSTWSLRQAALAHRIGAAEWNPCTNQKHATRHTVHGLPLTKNLQMRAGLRFNGFDVSVFADNLLNQHPELFRSRDVADDTSDQLYFGRGVRPRSYGLTATYRY